MYKNKTKKKKNNNNNNNNNKKNNAKLSTITQLSINNGQLMVLTVNLSPCCSQQMLEVKFTLTEKQGNKIK